MAAENLTNIYSLPAGADLSAEQYSAIVINTSGEVVLAGAGAVPHGHLQNAPEDGEDARFVHLGTVVKVKLAGTVTLGARLSSNASGKYVVSATSGHAYVGVALSAGVSGDIIEMLRIPDLGAVA